MDKHRPFRKSGSSPARLPDGKRAIAALSALLTGIAVMLAVSLTPRNAQDDAALTGMDAAARLQADCEIIQQMYYTPCGHSMTRRQTLPPELAGKTRSELEGVYDLWQVTSFSPSSVEMTASFDLYCPQHVVLRPDDSGILCLWANHYGDALMLLSETGSRMADLPDAYQEMLLPGMGFATREEAEKWLENIDS
ncbi:MAG: hypothetical protein E7333_03740 [Clostridiales bacterium]|nr:hypothetical protein [Clostridiales bacterium]